MNDAFYKRVTRLDYVSVTRYACGLARVLNSDLQLHNSDFREVVLLDGGVGGASRCVG